MPGDVGDTAVVIDGLTKRDGDVVAVADAVAMSL